MQIKQHRKSDYKASMRNDGDVLVKGKLELQADRLACFTPYPCALLVYDCGSILSSEVKRILTQGLTYLLFSMEGIYPRNPGIHFTVSFSAESYRCYAARTAMIGI